MARSVWKNPFSEEVIFKNVFKNINTHKPIQLWSKNSVIFPAFIGCTFSIYNGKKFINLQVHNGMIGHKFGEFITTRKKAVHKKK